VSSDLLRRIAVCIGMPRAGTTWLYQNLKNHPQISVAKNKETLHYLNSSEPEELIAFFEPPFADYLIDINPTYFLDLEVIGKIGKFHEKIILIRRERSEWEKSIIAQSERFGTTENLKTMLFPFPRGDGSEIILDLNSFDSESQIDEIREILGEKLEVLEFETLQDNPVEFMSSVERHIGCSEYFSQENIDHSRINSREHKIPIVLRALYRMRLIQPLGKIARLILPKKIYERLLEKYWYGG